MAYTKQQVDELFKNMDEMGEFVTRPLIKRVLDGEDVDVVFSKESVSDQCKKLLKMREEQDGI